MNSARFFGQVLVSPLHDAAARGNLEQLQELLHSPPEDCEPFSVLTTDNAKNTPLHWAAGSGHEETVTFLIEEADRCDLLPALLSAQDLLGDTALHRAVWRSHQEVVKILVEAGIDRRVENCMGQTAIDLVRDNVAIGCLLQSGEPLPGVDYSDDDEEDEEDEGALELNLSDTEYSSEDEDIGVMLVEQRMSKLFAGAPPSTIKEKEETKDEETDSDDDLPPLVDDD